MTNNNGSTKVHAAFRFIVSLDGEKVGAFTECVLPTIEWEMEEIKEGGLNTYIHQLPGRRKSSKITLKNGVGVAEDLVSWYTEALSENYTRHQVSIELLDSEKGPVMSWDIEKAYPTKWKGPDLKSGENTIAIQELELACGEITVGA